MERNAEHGTTVGPPRRGMDVLAMIALALVALTSGSVFSLVAAGNGFEDELDQIRGDLDSSTASDAGIAAAVHDLRSGGSGDLGDADHPIRFGSGSYWVRTTMLESGLLSVESTGRSHGERTRTQLVARRKSEGSLEIETISLRTWFGSESEG